jgi:hypothetical protein
MSQSHIENTIPKKVERNITMAETPEMIHSTFKVKRMKSPLLNNNNNSRSNIQYVDFRNPYSRKSLDRSNSYKRRSSSMYSKSSLDIKHNKNSRMLDNKNKSIKFMNHP